MRILLFQPDAKLRDRVGFWLENTVGAEVVHITNLPDAILETRDGEPRVDAVVMDPDREAIQAYRQFRKEIGKSMPLILCLEGLSGELSTTETGPKTRIINRREIISGLAEAFLDLQTSGALPSSEPPGAAAEGSSEFESAKQFVRIRSPLLISVIPLKGDVYLRLSPFKFVKMFREGDQFDDADLEKYWRKKGVEYFYLKRTEITEFLEKYKSEILKLLRHATDLTQVGQAEISVHELSHELARTIGVNPLVQSVIASQMQATVAALEKSPRLADVMSKIRALQGNYLHVHSVMAGHLACGLAHEMGIGNRMTFQKLTMAAFLHDLELRDPELARFDSIAEFDQQLLGAAAKKDFLDHPRKAAELASVFYEIPPDTDKIILQHHERPNQSGFPHRIGGARIFPLAAIFMVAHELARFHLENQGRKTTVGDFLKVAAIQFDSGLFRKALVAVKQCFGG